MLARKIILGFGFAVLMPMLIHYGIDVFVPSSNDRAYYQEVSHLREAERDASGGEGAPAQSARAVGGAAHHTVE